MSRGGERTYAGPRSSLGGFGHQSAHLRIGEDVRATASATSWEGAVLGTSFCGSIALSHVANRPTMERRRAHVARGTPCGAIAIEALRLS
jgi:hypothetical protein